MSLSVGFKGSQQNICFEHVQFVDILSGFFQVIESSFQKKNSKVKFSLVWFYLVFLKVQVMRMVKAKKIFSPHIIAHYWLEFKRENKPLLNNPFTLFHPPNGSPHGCVLIEWRPDPGNWHFHWQVRKCLLKLWCLITKAFFRRLTECGKREKIISQVPKGGPWNKRKPERVKSDERDPGRAVYRTRVRAAAQGTRSRKRPGGCDVTALVFVEDAAKAPTFSSAMELAATEVPGGLTRYRYSNN